MRVLMLGWEFPPFISGGLGTACYGLTRALSRRGVEVLFVLPRPVDGETADHVRLIREGGGPAAGSFHGGGRRESAGGAAGDTYRVDEFEHVTFRAVPSRIRSPYEVVEGPTLTEVGRKRAADVVTPEGEVVNPQGMGVADWGGEIAKPRAAGEVVNPEGMGVADWGGDVAKPQAAGESYDPGEHYNGDVVADAQRYAERCLRLVDDADFDVIHAHDWMTFPAGLAVAGRSGKPLVVHVHSTEFDRSGENVHEQVQEIERRGMHGAMTVVCVSHLTKNLCVHRYGVPAEKVEVVYNGIESNGPMVPRVAIQRGDKIVLFLGRITHQKGPEHFIAAAKKVLEKVENVKFVMAGSGDRVGHVMAMAEEMGISEKVLFTGFLRGEDVERVFGMADVYVMPSVSEPFGIAPLEAIRHDVPVIISRNSGVAEVLRHALKVDAWDADDVADKVIAVLRHPPLSRTLREHADLEVRRLTWDGAAGRCVEIYQDALEGMGGRGSGVQESKVQESKVQESKV